MPQWFVADPQDQTAPKQFELSNPETATRCIMTVEIAVARDEEVRTYGFDPEMIVEPDG